MSKVVKSLLITTKIMADALRASEEKYRGLFEQSEAAVFVFGAEKNVLTPTKLELTS